MTKAELERGIAEYGSEIYSFCRYITGSMQEGEDLYQDTFLKALEIMDRLEEEKNPKGYLLAIAIKLWKNKRRKYAWRKRIVNVESLDELTENYGDMPDMHANHGLPEEEALANEQVKYVHNIIESLPSKLKITLYLHFTAELTLKEIADCLKIPEGTVKSRLHKAKKLIKEQLEGTEYDR